MASIKIPDIIDNLDSISAVDGLSANQGRILKERQGMLENLKTTDKDSLVNAINEIEEEVNVLIARLGALVDVNKES